MFGRRKRCKACGEFAKSSHTCPVRNVAVPSSGADLQAVLEEEKWDESWSLEDYARKADVARLLYQEQVVERETQRHTSTPASGLGICGYCGQNAKWHYTDCDLFGSGVYTRYVGSSDTKIHWPEDENGCQVSGRFPDTDRLNSTLASTAVEFLVSADVAVGEDVGLYSHTSYVSGIVKLSWTGHARKKILRNNPDAAVLSVSASDLACMCREYAEVGHCKHVDAVMNRVMGLVGEEPRSVRWLRKFKQGTLFKDEALSQVVDDEAEFLVVHEAAQRVLWSNDDGDGNLARSAAARVEAAAGWRSDAEISYVADDAAFSLAMREGPERRRNGRPIIGMITSRNILDGACQRGNGQAFGLEIEYDFPESATREERDLATQRIARELYREGLTSSPEMKPYGWSGKREFVDVSVDDYGVGTWALEHDGSVAGELVTSGLYDEPDTWMRLEKAVQIITRNGGVASTRAGSHVHVGTQSYKGEPAKYAELMRLVGQNEDALVVLASSPERGQHRATGYSRPVPNVPISGFRNVAEAKEWQQGNVGRESLVNMLNVKGGHSSEEDHVEFRVFDSTLDPSVIQFQVKLAVGLVNAAERRADEGGTQRRKEPWGSHRQDSTIGDTLPIRSLLDTVFRRETDKADGAAIAGVVRYSEPNGSRRY